MISIFSFSLALGGDIQALINRLVVVPSTCQQHISDMSDVSLVEIDRFIGLFILATDSQKNAPGEIIPT